MLMRKTVNTNIASLPFILDENAYEELRTYLDDIESRLLGDKVSQMANIERRIANMFDGRLSEEQQVVDLNMVADAKTMIGSPETFGEVCSSVATPTEEVVAAGAKEPEIVEEEVVVSHYDYPTLLYRSRTEYIIAGVCGGLATYTNLPVKRLRILFVVLTAVGLLTLFAYLLLWYFVPIEPQKLSESSDDNSVNSKI
ncbi:MAG: PspC domain-containing protein [Alistipes sp.]|nr:PspC domain-containing protein [Alistipes sp.]